MIPPISPERKRELLERFPDVGDLLDRIGNQLNRGHLGAAIITLAEALDAASKGERK